MDKDNSTSNKQKLVNNKSLLYLMIVISLITVAYFLIFKDNNIFVSQPTTNQATNSASTNNLKDPYENWKDCENTGLVLSLKVPQTWTCTNNDVGPNRGFITLKNNSFTIEIENAGRSFGCMDSSDCSDTKIYESNLISIYLETVNNVDQYMFGIFKDNTDVRSYGGVKVIYKGINERKMSENEKEILFMILDSMERQ